MEFQDQYEQYYQQIPDDIQKCLASGRRLVLGYTSDLDVLLEWDEEIFNSILDAYLTEPPSVKNGDAIHSVKDFARIVSAYAARGQGGRSWRNL